MFDLETFSKQDFILKVQHAGVTAIGAGQRM